MSATQTAILSWGQVNYIQKKIASPEKSFFFFFQWNSLVPSYRDILHNVNNHEKQYKMPSF